MKKRLLTLSLIAGVAAGLAFLAPRLASAAGSSSPNTFVREPILVYTTQLLGSTQTDSTSLVLYQDGFLTVATTTPRVAGGRHVIAGNIGPIKARSWYRALIQLGAASLPDGPNPDPTVGGASTLTILEPGTLGSGHTFSFAPADYPDLQRLLDGIILRLGI